MAFLSNHINYNKNKLGIYDFRENKEIQYMNRLSIVLKFELLNSLAEDVQKLFVQNLFFWSKHFWA